MCFRHELKYLIGYPQYLELKSRLQAVMEPDGHAGEDGRYLIRSIYFDNYQDKALREKLDGISIREKFRIRYYNDDLSYITLEKKVKDNMRFEKGLKDVSTVVKDRTVTITYDAEKTNVKNLQAGFKKFNYEAEFVKETKKDDKKADKK